MKDLIQILAESPLPLVLKTKQDLEYVREKII